MAISAIVKILYEPPNFSQDEDLEKNLEATRVRQMLTMRDDQGNTALHKAARYGQVEVLRELMKALNSHHHYFSIFSANKSGETPLYIAAIEKYPLFVAELLHTCNSTSMPYGGPHGRTALHAAVMAGYKRTTEILLKEKMHLAKETDDKRRTPLHYAAHLGRRPIAKLLLETDASAAYMTDEETGTTALHMAAWRGHIGVMEDIITYCPGCRDIVDKNGRNYLHFAIVALEPTQFTILIKGYIISEEISLRNLLHQKDVNGSTPLDVINFGPTHLRVKSTFLAASILKAHGFGRLVYGISDPKMEKLVQEMLKEIGDKAEVAGVPVHNSFRECFVWKDDGAKGEKIEILNKATNAHLLVATLVATVTFTAAFTVPGGYKSEQGTATLSRDSAFKAFIITDTLAFVFSLLAIALHFTVASESRKLVQYLLEYIQVADYLTCLAMAAMVIAFSTGTYAVLESSSGFAIAACSLGISFFPGLIIVTLILAWLSTR
ncbi:ankyrin repeat-containing protein NPR4-like [Durio zibethinus]|uniref:Ankyrin repeat-containing protein NPR4-like n=1 Tax=Durio zibethinus TaxID=66656 RepID=A0A6P6A7M5_DURZI|nr:ankyrin repeat-containing protein NPR4-like [Durio zibethinus]